MALAQSAARTATISAMEPHRIWDIFCTVVDNHGDLGVCWRLTRQLLARGQTVRLWVDDASALEWMAPQAQNMAQLLVLPWTAASQNQVLLGLPPAQVWIEAFGCCLPTPFVAHGVLSQQRLGLPAPTWINLEYLSAESWVPGIHGLPSPVMSGPAKGWTKHFFYPGFTPETGGLLREPDLFFAQADFSQNGHDVIWRDKHAPLRASGAWLVSLFCYAPAALVPFLKPSTSHRHHMVVPPGLPMTAMQKALAQLDIKPRWDRLPYTDQDGFDAMLWACDLNFFRGEDSLVRAIWAGKPFVWHIYPQDDNAHHAKLKAFLEWLQAPEDLCRFHHTWNGLDQAPLPTLNTQTLQRWGNCTQQARQRLSAQTDLVTQLIEFISLKSTSLSH